MFSIYEFILPIVVAGVGKIGVQRCIYSLSLLVRLVLSILGTIYMSNTYMIAYIVLTFSFCVGGYLVRK